MICPLQIDEYLGPDELHGPVKIIFVLLRKVKVYNFIRRMKVKVYNLVRHTWLIVADDLLMLGLSSFRRKLFDFQAFHNQAHIINLSGIIIYFCGTYYLYAREYYIQNSSFCCQHPFPTHSLPLKPFSVFHYQPARPIRELICRNPFSVKSDLCKTFAINCELYM